jgi:chaperonin GroES
LFCPTRPRRRPQEGLVEAVGIGRMLDSGTRVPIELKVGDCVLFAKYAGSEFKLEDIEYLIISEKDVLAVITGKTTKAKK